MPFYIVYYQDLNNGLTQSMMVAASDADAAKVKTDEWFSELFWIDTVEEKKKGK